MSNICLTNPYDFEYQFISIPLFGIGILTYTYLYVKIFCLNKWKKRLMLSLELIQDLEKKCLKYKKNYQSLEKELHVEKNLNKMKVKYNDYINNLQDINSSVEEINKIQNLEIQKRDGLLSLSNKTFYNIVEEIQNDEKYIVKIKNIKNLVKNYLVTVTGKHEEDENDSDDSWEYTLED